jgi:predicted transcriptional regulator
MASSTDSAVILLSIFPEFADAILRGEKRVEFRKPKVCASASHILVYSTSPDMRIVGYFEVKKVHRASPRLLWKRFGKVGTISRDAFFSYYAGHDEAIGFEVGSVWRFKRPKSLGAVQRGLKPPQSFTYLPSTILERLRRWSEPAGIDADLVPA